MPTLVRNRTPAVQPMTVRYGSTRKEYHAKPYAHLSYQRQQIPNTTQELKGAGPSSKAKMFSDAAFHRGIKMTTVLTRVCHLSQSRARRIQSTPCHPIYRRPTSYHPIHIFHAVSFLPATKPHAYVSSPPT